MKYLVSASLLLLTSCVPPRDPVDPAAKECLTTSQCPADGNHYCDRTKGVCVTCDGPCPWVNAPTSDAGSSAASDSAAESDTIPSTDGGAGEAGHSGPRTDAGDIDGLDASSGSSDSCAGKCDADPDTLSGCKCDAECGTYGDCCSDYARLCADGG